MLNFGSRHGGLLQVIMVAPYKRIALLVLSGLFTTTLATAGDEIKHKQVLGAACESPPPMHCPPRGCPVELIGQLGNVVDPRTNRKFFLDYPCDLRPGEKVTFVLNLHSGGSIGNWQRHYFPIMDLKEKYRLVIATPSGVVRGWVPENDYAHLQNIVELVYEKFGKENIRAFWMAGHSQGGLTCSRLICSDFYRDKVDGWVSLSGGRAGTPRNLVRRRPAGEMGENPQPPPVNPQTGVRPSCDFSHIYSSGEHELPDTGLPDFSPWAQKYECAARVQLPDIVDTIPGYVYDSHHVQKPSAEWGGKPRPGTAQAFLYPNCKGGRVVADIIRMDKGHTEGLEPNVTENIVKLMLSAPNR
jgi:hypothetical protein